MDNTKAVAHIFDIHAQLYQDKYMDVSLYKNSLDSFCSLVPTKNAELLDIACGPGNITKYILNKRPDYKISGIDIAPNMLVLAAMNNPTAQFKQLNAKNIAQLSKKYDAVVSGFCLPYLSKKETLEHIEQVSLQLKPQGVFYISTMEDPYTKSGLKNSSSGSPEQLYMYYHEATYLIEGLENSNFRILTQERIALRDQPDATANDLILIAKKKC